MCSLRLFVGFLPAECFVCLRDCLSQLCLNLHQCRPTNRDCFWYGNIAKSMHMRRTCALIATSTNRWYNCFVSISIPRRRCCWCFFSADLCRFLFGFSFIACMHVRYTSLLLLGFFPSCLFLFCMLCAQVNNLQICHVIRLIRDFYCTNDCCFSLSPYFFVRFSSSLAFRRRNIVLGRYLPTMLIIRLQAMH